MGYFYVLWPELGCLYNKAVQLESICGDMLAPANTTGSQAEKDKTRVIIRITEVNMLRGSSYDDITFAD